MRRSRILVALALVAGLTAPATAHAAQRPHHAKASPAKASAAKQSTLLLTAQTVARQYWGAAPCSGQLSIVAQRRLAAGVDRSTDAWVTFDTALGRNNLAAPASSYRSCTISLARWRWPTAASMTEDWDMLCLTMIHETGHLLGHPHDLRRGSVMAPVFTDTSNVPKVCRATRPPSAR